MINWLRRSFPTRFSRVVAEQDRAHGSRFLLQIRYFPAGWANPTALNVAYWMGEIPRRLREAGRPALAAHPSQPRTTPGMTRARATYWTRPARPPRCRPAGKSVSHAGGGAAGGEKPEEQLTRQSSRGPVPGAGPANKVRSLSAPPGRLLAPGAGAGGAKPERVAVGGKNLVSSRFSPKFSLRLPEKMLIKDQLCGRSVFFGLLPGELDRKLRSKVTAVPSYGNTFCSLLTPPGVTGTARGGPGGSLEKYD